MSNNLIIVSNNTLAFAGRSYRCAVGREGLTEDKREGDHKTPVGSFSLRQCFYRPDRLPRPVTALPCFPLAPDDGWCDDPGSPLYNRHFKISEGATAPQPSSSRRREARAKRAREGATAPASFERLWREDGRYDIIVPLGYNDDPVVAGKGSAIFLHVAAPDYAPTEGCVALARDDLLAVLKQVTPETIMIVPKRSPPCPSP